MPRRWTNSYGGNGGASVRHQFVAATPARTYNAKGYPVDMRFVDSILSSNARIASKENKFKK